MIQSQILQPIVVLLAWTMIMWLWMYATRIPAMSKAGIDPNDARRTKALDETLPAEVQWKAHNYNHLHEAPTVFYAVALVLAILGLGDGMNALIEWIYVLGVFPYLFFIRTVFRPDRAWAGALVGFCSIFLLVGTIFGGASFSLDNPWFMVQWVGYTTPCVWLGWEALEDFAN